MKPNRNRRALLVGVAFVGIVVTSGCGEEAGVPAPSDDALVQATSFAPPPPQLPASSIPTPVQLSALFNAARDYDIRVADRVKLFADVSQDRVDELARRFVLDDVSTEFSSVTEMGNGSIGAKGVGRYDGEVTQADVGPIPFVADAGVWKISGRWACAVVGTC